MKLLFYRWMTAASKAMGTWVFDLAASGVAAGFFFLFPGRVANSVRFYRVLIPNKTVLQYLWYAWRQYRNFTTIYRDRLVWETGKGVRVSSSGLQYLRKAVENKTGAIVLMSHMGNWEIAARLLAEKIPHIHMMFFMGRREQEQLEDLQKKGLASAGIRIVPVDRERQDPLALVEAAGFLRGGGVVSMTGDRLWHQSQRAVPVAFLGHRAYLPAVAHRLALLAGAPLLMFFSRRTGPAHYHLRIAPPLFLTASARQDRQAAIAHSAQLYANAMEAALHRQPFEWYHFEPFLGAPLD